MNILKGLIIHSISGFYYVEAADAVYECKAKGAFRNKKMSPLVGDIVDIDVDGDKGFIVNIYPRRNSLNRPPVANIDVLFIVSSVEKPKPNIFVLDKLTAFAIKNGITPVIVFSKCDLSDPEEYLEIYGKTKFRTIITDNVTGQGIEELSEIISGKVCAFSGNSGVGKSSLLNLLCENLSLETNEISEKLGRGKHTTRSVKLYHYNDGFVADTPGFSAIDLVKDKNIILKDELVDCFPEFGDYTDECKFGLSCSHTNDKGCAVVRAVNEGLISKSRHESYMAMYEEVKKINEWDIQ